MATQLNAGARVLAAEINAGPYDYDAEAFHKDMLKLGFVETSKGKHRVYAPGPSLTKAKWKGQVKLLENPGVPPQYGILVSLTTPAGKLKSYRAAGKLRADLPSFMAEIKSIMKG